MTEQLQVMQQQIVAAVQQQLTQYSAQVSAEVQRLRDEMTAERTARTQLDGQLRALAGGLEVSTSSNATFQSDLQRALEERLTEFGGATKRRHEEMNQRLDRVVDEANVGLTAAVESATRPILRDVEHRQSKVETDIGALDNTLRKFDEQAGRMATHINQVASSVEARIEQVTTTATAEAETRVAGLAARLDEVSAQAARHQADVSNIVGQRVDDAESRINDKINSASARLTDEVGTRIADIDAYVGRVAVGLDEGIVALNDRIAEVHTRFDDMKQELAEMRETVKAVDAEALEEITEKVSSALGEAMLVRIDMERFQTSIGESLDKSAIRLTNIETQMQEQAVDTEMAVQLERLEEVERALIALDPAQFVRASSVRSPGQSSGDQAVRSLETDMAIAPLSAPSAHQPNDQMDSFAPPASATH